jgi:YidC/Oxa1 family membrane protein insertase
MQKTDTKNLIFAVVLSSLIIFAWQYFYAGPKMQKEQQAAQTQQQTAQTAAPAAEAPKSIARDDAIKASARIPISSPFFEGSINLTGARIDDLHLAKYRETIEPGSPTITLFSPSGTPNAYFAEQGVIASPGTAAKLPDVKTVWQAAAGAKLTAETPLTLTWDNGGGVVFTRTISLEDGYVFNVTQSIDNKSAAPVAVQPYALVQRQDTPKIAGWWVFYEGMLGVLNGSLQEVKYAAAQGSAEAQKTDSTGGWLGFTDKYWASALIPDPKSVITGSFQHKTLDKRDVYQADYLAKSPLVVQPGTSGSYQDRLYAGAKVVETIKAVGAKDGIDKFDLMVDWGWFSFLTKPFYSILSFIQSIVGNFGIALMMMTLLVKAAVFPLANKSYASMSRMKKLQPEMEKIKLAYPDDRLKQQQATMELYKREKVSPAAGCLPVVVQIPVFFALYKVILTSLALRHAPFFGWVHDLSAPDPTNLFNLFGLIPWTPPHALTLGIWPLLMGITMWIQMRLNPAPPDPVQASLFNWMPIIFTFSLGSFPVGLVIYWAWSNSLSILQQSYIMKKHGTDVNLFGNIRDSLPFLKKKPAG